MDIRSDDSEKVLVRGKCVLVPVVGSNYAEAAVSVEGVTLRSKCQILAELSGNSALTSVRVIDTKEVEGMPLDVRLRDQDFGHFRAMWATLEGKPNLLLISARHKSLARYLGPGPAFDGQNSPHFRVLVAEIVAEMICRRLLEEEAKRKPRDFEFSATSHEIIGEVFGYFARRMRDFLPKAHSAMLSDVELRS